MKLKSRQKTVAVSVLFITAAFLGIWTNYPFELDHLSPESISKLQMKWKDSLKEFESMPDSNFEILYRNSALEEFQALDLKLEELHNAHYPEQSQDFYLSADVQNGLYKFLLDHIKDVHDPKEIPQQFDGYYSGMSPWNRGYFQVVFLGNFYKRKETKMAPSPKVESIRELNRYSRLDAKNIDSLIRKRLPPSVDKQSISWKIDGDSLYMAYFKNHYRHETEHLALYKIRHLHSNSFGIRRYMKEDTFAYKQKVIFDHPFALVDSR